MEGDVVIVAVLGQRLDLGDVLRSVLRVKLDDDGAILELYGQQMLRLLGDDLAGEGGDIEDRRKGESKIFHVSSIRMAKAQDTKRALSARKTVAGTKPLTSPPMAAIWRTNVAVMGREAGSAGRKTVWISGAMRRFIPAICIS